MFYSQRYCGELFRISPGRVKSSEPGHKKVNVPAWKSKAFSPAHLFKSQFKFSLEKQTTKKTLDCYAMWTIPTGNSHMHFSIFLVNLKRNESGQSCEVSFKFSWGIRGEGFEEAEPSLLLLPCWILLCASLKSTQSWLILSHTAELIAGLVPTHKSLQRPHQNPAKHRNLHSNGKRQNPYSFCCLSSKYRLEREKKGRSKTSLMLLWWFQQHQTSKEQHDLLKKVKNIKYPNTQTQNQNIKNPPNKPKPRTTSHSNQEIIVNFCAPKIHIYFSDSSNWEMMIASSTFPVISDWSIKYKWHFC